MRGLRGTHTTAKIATFLKELSLEMLPRSGQRGRISRDQLGFVTLRANIMAVTQIPFYGAVKLSG